MPQDSFAKRKAIALPASYRTRRLGARAIVAHLSEQGCTLRGFPPGGRISDRIRICLDRLEPLWGEIRWLENGDAGVQFDRPLHPAVVRHIKESQAGARVGWG